MSHGLAALIIVYATLAGMAGVVVWAPDYLTALGFPLDDAWIHAVYGRELARSGMLAYNPGTPATGSTAPLWSAVVAVPHLLTSGPNLVAWVKWCGLILHLLTALVLYAALHGGEPARRPWALAGAVLVALHPDLIAASVSGMEVALAALAAAGLLYIAAGPAHGGDGAPPATGSRRRWGWVYAALAALAFLVRPELAVVALVLPLAFAVTRLERGSAAAGTAGPSDVTRRGGHSAAAGAVVMVAAAVAGTGLAAGVLAARNLAVSGLPLPATFYAKVGHGPALGEALRMGFSGLLGQLPLANSLLLLGAVLVLALVFLRTSGSRAVVTAAASFVSGVAFCAVSFALVAPIDAGAFYHQRYVLPALPLLVAPLPLLLGEALARSLPARAATVATATVVALCLVMLARHAPSRFAHLANDARNIDDVQVALGRHLAGAAADDVVWAIDAGAVRYFGNAFVVDMMGLNTPELLGRNAQAFLDAHAPRWVEVVPSWSNLNDGSSAPFAGVVFQPTTPYSVTGFPLMQRHVLVHCETGDAPARYGVRARVFEVACAAAEERYAGSHVP